MGTTLWALGKNSTDAGDDDRSAMYDASEALDELCDEIGVTKFSEFIDWADFNANLGDEGAEDLPPEWHDANHALPTLNALRSRVAADPSELGFPGLLEELDGCIAKVSEFASRSEPFHLCAVM